MNIEKTMYGSLKISVLIQNQLFERQYYGYSKTEAIKKFKTEVTNIKNQLK
jgi:hypothetical protein